MTMVNIVNDESKTCYSEGQMLRRDARDHSINTLTQSDFNYEAVVSKRFLDFQSSYNVVFRDYLNPSSYSLS